MPCQSVLQPMADLLVGPGMAGQGLGIGTQSSVTAGTGTGHTVIKKSRSEEAPRFTCSTAEELDLNVLRFQNKKLFRIG